MKRETTPHAGQTRIPLRAASWIAIAAILAAVLALGAARSAQALTISSPVGPGATLAVDDFAEDPAEDEEGEDEEGAELEECELSEDEEEEEVCEESEVEEEATPPECLLSSATATVATSPAHDSVRIAVRYTSRTAAAVKVELKLRGRKGPLSLGGDQERFKRSGVYRETQRLTDPQMAKVVAAKSFTVELLAVNTPRYCHRYFDSELTVKRASGGGLTWSAPAARSGA
ncbi:MAG TPA: hypothetical protein VHR18_02535 [Solirubrobacterales bacterium]|jgi:hypothetical protein|nr:hypothetical protein [Solirubrobacterales bacterium]